MLNPRLNDQADELAARFREREPFRHVVIDDFFEPAYCVQLLAQFPAFERGNARNENGGVGNKSTIERIRGLGPAFSALDNRLTITSDQGERAVKIFYRDPSIDRPKAILSNPDIAELIARLAGAGPKDAPQKLDFSYGQIVSVVQAMTRTNQVVAMLGNTRVPTPLVIQSTPRLQSEIDTAPTIPEQSRPQGDTSGPEMGKIPEPEPHSEARK